MPRSARDATPSTLVELLSGRAEQQPTQLAYTFLEDVEGDESARTHAEMDLQARRIARALGEATSAGERAVLLYPPGLEYIAGFFGCLYAGVVAVPAYPPDPSRLERTLPRLRAIIQDAQARVVLTTSFIKGMVGFLAEQAPDLAKLTWLATDELPSGGEEAWRGPDIRADTLAFLQYTSGSTGTPKGVMLRHSHLVHNLEMIRQKFELDATKRFMSWLPPYHDMGLIGGILSPLYAGCLPTVLMSPYAFLKRPARWLEAISRFQVTVSGAPNFAFDLCVRKSRPEQRAALDLSSWTLAFNGAEPVRAETLERFVEAFRPSGFGLEAFYPCYGLAEGTLIAAGGVKAEPPVVRAVDVHALEQRRVVEAPPGGPGSRLLVGSGSTLSEQEWAIVDPESPRRCPDGAIGEIWLKSPSVASGYWNRPEESERTFRAHLEDSGEGPFLRTGDLGFVRDGELFVVSRIKDLIILHGRNHAPQDIEASIDQCHPALRPGCTAAFSIDVDGEERLVVVQEADPRQAFEPDAVVAAVRGAVAERHAIQLHTLVLIPPGSIHKTTSGKIQRQATRAAFLSDRLESLHVWRAATSGPAPSITPPLPPEAATAAPPAPVVAQGDSERTRELEAWLVETLAAATGMAAERIDIREPFALYGVDSVIGVRLAGDLEARLGHPVPATLVWDYPTIEAMARHLTADDAPRAHAPGASAPDEAEPIAIIGLGCRFPGAEGVSAYWRLLTEGGDAIREVPADRWDVDAYYDANPLAPGKMATRWGGFLEGIDGFDREFFGIPPREAARMDPQQRLLLEVAWEALEDAGVPSTRLAGSRTGVFVGISTSDYGSLQLARRGLTDAYAGTGSALSIAANRLSYLLDLRGPSMAVDTACSSSLVAVHLACQSLRSGEAELALAGGVNVLLSPELTVNFSKAGFMAPDGRCKPFDASANGYVRGEGAGVVVLKPLSRARADGDTIHAVIRGSAVNQDGRSNGLTAPNRLAQEAVLREAYRRAGVSPGQVQYVEAHGTGTALGDPIEAQALGAVLAEDRAPGRPCAIGSVKSNVGHLEAAAGIAGLLKVVLSLRERTLPPTVHFRAPNPHIPFARLPLRVQQHLEPWPVSNTPPLAGVSSFGFGGTNAHVVVEGVPPREEARHDGPTLRPQVLPLSARSPEALRALARRYLERASANPGDVEARLESLCQTAGTKRGHHAQRLSLTVGGAEDLREKLTAFLAGQSLPGIHTGQARPGARPKLAFVFSGQGPQWPHLARELTRRFPVLRDTLEQCDALLRPLAGWSLLEELEKEEAHTRLAHTEFAQPVLFAVQVGLAALWRSLGVEPDTVVGHSAGEVAAAHVAGLLSLPEAIRVIHQRGLAAQRASGLGRMALVELGAEEASRLLAGLEDRVSIAAFNGPTATVLSGDTTELGRIVASLEQRGVYARLLDVNYASHSPQMEPFCPGLEESLAGLRVAAPTLPLVSTVDAEPVTTAAYDAAYWARQLRAPVQFARTVERLLEDGHTLFVELAPHPLLLVELGQRLREREVPGAALPSLRRGEEDGAVFLGSLGALYTHGLDLRWDALQPARPAIPLPTYPWQRERCWLPGPRLQASGAETGTEAPEADDGPEPLADWLYSVSWEPLAAGSDAVAAGVPWLLLADGGDTATALAERLRARGGRVELLPLAAGSSIASVREAVEARLQAAGSALRVVHLGGLDADVTEMAGLGELRAALALGCAPLVGAFQALARTAPTGSRLWAVTRGAQRVGATHPTSVAQAPVWGLGRAIASERPDLWGGTIDLAPATASREQVEPLLHALGAEGEDQLAVREGRLLAARLERRRELAEPPASPRPRPDATYLITGGLGGIGTQAARWLIGQGARRLILMGRTRLPPRAQWRRLEESSPLAGPVRAVRELEALGASIHVASVDVADEAALRTFLDDFREEGWPEIRGVLHTAGVLPAQDRRLVDIDERDLDFVFRPKAEGSWLLHRLLRDTPLDFFVGFSSVTALVGSPVQPAYAAANSFLDALAHERRALGLPALSINWGLWAEAGMGVRPDQGTRLSRLGFQPMSPTRALRALGLLLGADAAQAAVMSVQWDVLRRILGASASPRFVARVHAEPSSASSHSLPAEALSERLRSLGEAERREQVESFLRGETAAVIGLEPSRLDGTRPLRTLGLDSIMALELRNRIRARLGVQLPIVELVRGPSLDELAASVAGGLATDEATSTSAVEAAPVPTHGDFPLTAGQWGLWFQHQLSPHTSEYNVTHAARVRSELDVPRLHRAFQALVDRHAALRTLFVREDGQPVQRVLEHAPVAFHTEDASAWEPARLSQRMAEEAARPFDLANGPLFRVHAFSLAPADHALLLCFHHIIVDMASLAVLLQELGVLYESLGRGEAPALAPVLLNMPGTEQEQREVIAREGERLWEYWRHQLAGEPPSLELPSFHPRPPVQTYTGADHSFRLHAPVAQRLLALARERGVTLYTLLLAAYQTLLHRYTGQDDIWVGSPASGRTRPLFGGVVGYLVNQVVLRGDLSGDPSFDALLARTEQVVVGALAHQELPFTTLVDRLRVRRDPSRPPLTQVELVLQRSYLPGQEVLGAFDLAESGVRLQVGNLEVESLALERRVAPFDLTLTFTEVGGTLAGTLRYNVDLFDAATMARMAGHLAHLLEAIAADPSRPISRLPLLSAEEHRALTPPPRMRHALAPGEVCLHRRFEARAAAVPGAEALTFEQQRLSYAELDARANQLARYLVRQGVERGDLVGLYLERSPEMVVAVLAILKAGAAYVPIDTAYPADRARFMLEDSRARVLITQEKLPRALPEEAPRVVLLDEEAPRISAEERSRLDVPTAGDDLAYVIYTSGSTGRPKGVRVTHANVARLFDATRGWFPFDDSDVWTLFHSIAFDFSVWELWGALLHGGRLVVVPHLVSRTPESFLELLRAERVTVLNQTPSAFRSLIQADLAAPADAAPLSLRFVIFGGEALPLQSLRPWFERHGDERPLLVNMYGITETTVHVTYRPIRLKDLDAGLGSVIGEPIPDLSLLLLDAHQQPVPIGVPGEIHVGGAGVARGYLNRPELTSQRFLEDPYSSEPGARLYRSGDLARRLPDGDVEYLGRIDDQVKVRGFRIELGEIESAVARHPALREVVVVPREDGSGEKQLVAYAVAHAGADVPAVGELRSFLRERLPEYMVPAAFVFLDAIPLTANGKVNRRALPAPERLRPSLSEGYVEPASDLERLLSTVWSEALGVDRVGVEDNFFNLGGDSIRSLRVVARARERGLTLSVAEMFEHQTVRALASALRRGGEDVVRTEPFGLLSPADRAALPVGLTDAYPLSMLQAGFIFHSELRQGYEVYITSFLLRVRFDAEAMRRALALLARRHPMLRSAFDVSSFSEPLQLVSESAVIPLTMVDWRGRTEAEQQRDFEAWTHAERESGFEWRRPPLMRFHAHRFTDDTFRLTLSEPFLDGWSVASLWSELLRLYVATMAGESPVEPPPAATYRDFVALERATVQSEESRRFWSRELSALERAPVARWPLPPGDAPGQHVRIWFSVGNDVFAGLKHIASELALPVKSVLMAAHTRVVAQLTGREDIVTGIIANGRPEIPTSDQILGIFLNTIPLRLSLSGGTWMDLVRATFEAELARLPHRRFPLAQLQKSFGDGQPLFDTAFNYTQFHILDRLRELRGLEALDTMVTDQTYFTWTAYFNVNTANTELQIALDCNGLGTDQVEGVKSHYLSVLAAMSRAPGDRYDAGELLPERERQQLHAWNELLDTTPGETCVHHLVEAQAARTPGAIALVHGTRRLTYRELDARAGLVATRLRSLGVGPDSRVALCLDRTPELMVAMLGVMKAGGAYVPLDPAYPAERLAVMLEDSRAGVLVTARKQEATLPPHGAHVLYVEDMAAAPGVAGSPVAGGAGPGNLAYVLYTSGSTGRPKGVAVEHRSAVAFLRWALETFSREQLQGVLAATSVCFDLSIFELFTPLCRGGAVILAENALALAGLEAAGEVTLVNTVPSAMAELVRARALPPSVRTVNLAGEPLPGTLVRDLYATGTVEQVLNLYGPTEDTTYSTWTRVPRDAQGEPNIGRPLTGTSAWVLDARMRPVPIGVPGELYLGGAGLARGYLHRPELTAERFVPDPFSRRPGARLYRTGDLTRLLPTGELEYLGRIDNQVKVRGFRIELGEVDAVLRQHPSVRDVVVHAREDAPGEKRLVAYVVPAPASTPDTGVLKEHVAQRLPRYMVPSAFVVLEALPLTPNGKVNRKALPAPEVSRVEVGTLVAPRTPTEEVLCSIWARVLRMERLGTQDHFFELGGHSLLATQAVSRIREAFQVELPLRAIFEAPTVSALAERVEAAMQSRKGLDLPPLRPLPRTGEPPLSFAQQRLWFLDQLEPGSAAYNVPAAVRLTGALDAEVLRRALVELALRHESLRTTFHAEAGVAVQRIAPALEPAFTVEDLRALTEAERSAEVSRRAAAEARRPFDLTRGPLLRVSLLRLDDREHVLLLTLHHIVSDGWSMNVLVEDVTALYAALARGLPSSLAPLPVQYADYAAWQHQWLRGETLDAQLAWWRERLEGAPPSLELPTDRPRPAVQSMRGASWFVHLPRELSDAVFTLARHEGATPFMVLMAAFQVVLYRYSGQEDLSIGIPIAGRNRPELERLIGFFANTLVLRTKPSPSRPFRELVGQVREAALGAYAHQDVPFERLVEALQPVRDLSRSPLFQVMFTFQNVRLPDASNAGLELGLLEVDHQTSKFDLELVLTDSDEGLRGRFEYSTDLFDESTVARLATHLRTVLEAAVASPHLPLHALPLLSEDERQQVLVRWNSTDSDVPLHSCFHHLFEAQAARTPLATAVSDDEASLSYGALHRASNRLAHQLVSLGAGPDVLVSLLAPRDRHFLTSILGVLKAGSAWLPLDPHHPPQRLAQLLSQSASPLVLVADSLRPLLDSALALLPEASRPRVLSLADSLASSFSEDNLPPRSSPSHLAYVIFTSGSTGRPKGAMVEQRGMLNHLFAKVRQLEVSSRDVVAQTASQCFDISVWQFLCALLVGAQTRVFSDETAHSPLALLRALQAHSVSIVESVPSLLRALLDEADSLGALRPSLASLRWMIPTGEALPADLVRRWLLAWPSIPLLNAYGPTECSDDVTHGPLFLPPSSALVPIGRPILNTRLYVLDSHLRPLPVGVPGELFVGGVGVGRGYLFDSSRTAEAFLPDSFSSSPGARLYRTGDKARWLADGSLEFLGRLDFQVKVRGFRIEPGEVEACLNLHPSVGASAVLVHEAAPGDLHLVAYCCPRPGLSLDSDSLRLHLRQHLPEYMLPSALVHLPSLPLTPNGKLDRKALPAPTSFASTSRPFTAPRTRAEELLASLFARLLKQARVGVHDDFFQLGGHSLLATRLAALVRQAFGVELPLRALFEAPTPAQLASRLDVLRTRPDSGAMPPLRPALRESPLPLSFSQQRLWFLDQWQPNSSFYNVPAALWVDGPLQPSVLERCFAELVRRHEVLRTCFVSSSDGPSQRIYPEAHLPLALVDLSDVPESEREAEAFRLASEEARRPFDLARGPLLRVLLLRLDEQRHLLLLTMHHIVSDGGSMDVLLREVVALYEAFLKDEPSPLEPLSVQYADYAVWQREWLRDGTLQTQLDWWRQYLDGAPHTLELPTDRPRPALQTFHGALLTRVLPPGLSESLRAFHRREGVTPFVTHLAAFQALLHRYSGQDDFTVGSPVSGRTHASVEELIGFFVNTLVLRARIGPGTTFRELLAQARESTLGALSHQDLPFEKLVEALQPQRDLSRPPLFQVMLAYQQDPHVERALPGLTLRPLPLDGQGAKFDLTLSLTDTEAGLKAVFEYNTDLYDEATVARLAEHLATLLAEVIARPDQPLGSLALMEEAERRRLLVEWNDSRADFPADTFVHQLFTARAARAPDATALSFQGQHLTYGELEARANQLARHLQRLGVGPEVRVGLCVERSPDMVVGMLGVLKAGGAWVPLDATYPAERLAFVMEDAAVPLLLTQERLRASLPASPARVVCLDTDWGDIAREPTTPPQVPVAPETLAYVIYTSGSTGRPKGTLLTHRGLRNTALAAVREHGFHPRSRVLQFASIGFDASVCEVFASLLAGACLHLAPLEDLLPGAPLRTLLRDQAISAVTLTPSVLAQLEPEGLDALETLISAGEACTPELASRWAPGRRFLNAYGPTEVTVCATINLQVDPEQPSIGRPFPNVRVYVLDAALRPVPEGVPGELYVGGPGVARGYLGQPALTAERFVPDPFGAELGARLYRTGDRGRWRASGELEFLGRLDAQVKLRGIRIEPGEVEAVLREHPSIRDAAVVVREDIVGQPRLVAYVVPRADPLDTAALRAALRQRLPESMVPAAFVPLAALPLSAHGKLERRALPVPEEAHVGSGQPYVEPQGELERALATVWREVLGLRRVGRHERFFDVGGNSMSIVRVQARLREALQLEVTLPELFQHPTLSGLAEHLSRGASGTGELAASQERGGSRRERMEQQRQARRSGRGRKPGSET